MGCRLADPKPVVVNHGEVVEPWSASIHENARSLRHDKETERLPSIVTFNLKKRRVEETGRASLLRSSHFTLETRPICPGSRALTVVVTPGIATNTTEPRKDTRSLF